VSHRPGHVERRLSGGAAEGGERVAQAVEVELGAEAEEAEDTRTAFERRDQSAAKLYQAPHSSGNVEASTAFLTAGSGGKCKFGGAVTTRALHLYTGLFCCVSPR
jgi:hypothetical protein